jgi:hypothetical protein
VFPAFLFSKWYSVLFLPLLLLYITIVVTWSYECACFGFRLIFIFFNTKRHINPRRHLHLFKAILILMIGFISCLHLTNKEQTFSWCFLFSSAYLFLLYGLLKQRAMQLGCGRVLLFFIVKIKHNLLINIIADIFFTINFELNNTESHASKSNDLPNKF